ncbi:hypothetical protein Ae201684P_021448 [Aphanomyces euteiches]|nr:hypothetical protein Ae201684P_021448 [Aphanomyces euteiches]
MAENDSLDVLSDLSFLLAQDDSLNDELTILCEILEDSDDSDNASNKDVALPTEAATTSLKAQEKPNKHEKIGTGRTKYEGAIENKWSWLEVVPLQSNPNSHCFMTQVIVDVAPGAVVTTAEELATLEAMMQHASLLKSTQMTDAGWFNMEVTHIDNMDIPYPKLRSLVERGSLFMKTLEATVNETIRSHRQMRA